MPKRKNRQEITQENLDKIISSASRISVLSRKIQEKQVDHNEAAGKNTNNLFFKSAAEKRALLAKTAAEITAIAEELEIYARANGIEEDPNRYRPL